MNLFPSLFRHHKQDSASSLKNEIDRVFDNFFTQWPDRLHFEDNKPFFNPAVDVAETKEGIEVKAELPDMNKDDIHLHVQGDKLMLSGEKKFEEEKDEDKGYHMVERRYGSFSRVIPLPFVLEDTSNIHANYDKGVLKVLVPKPADAKSRQSRIDIN